MSREYAILSASEKFKVDFREVEETYSTVRSNSANDSFIVKYNEIPNSFNFLTPLKSDLTLSSILTTLSTSEWNNFDFSEKYPGVPMDGLEAFFNFDSSLTDSDFGSIELTQISNGGVYTYGIPNSGVSFEQQGDRLVYGINLWNQQESPTSFTAAFWVRRDIDFAPGSSSVMCGSVFGPMNFLFTENYGSNFNEFIGITFGIMLTGGNYNSLLASLNEVVLDKGIWTHLAGTLDTVERTIKLYVNGKMRATNSYSSTDRPGVAYIGNSPAHTGWNGFALNGSMLAEGGSEYGNEYKFDNFGLWRRALTSEEISSLYNHGYGALYQ